MAVTVTGGDYCHTMYLTECHGTVTQSDITSTAILFISCVRIVVIHVIKLHPLLCEQRERDYERIIPRTLI